MAQKIHRGPVRQNLLKATIAQCAGPRTRLLLAGMSALTLLALVFTGWEWLSLRHWMPSRQAFPVQGVEIGTRDGDISWTAIKAIGANFAYVDVTSGANIRDPAFATDLDAARAAGVEVGALHRYDPCQSADAQSANFVTLVPRDADLLPPAVALQQIADDCPQPVSDARVISELMTFLNQIEAHSGKAAVLKIGRRFEQHYHVASAFDRQLWLVRDRFPPTYAGRPFALWTANHALATAASPKPLRWVVAQP